MDAPGCTPELLLLTAGATDARMKLRAISAEGDLGLPPGSIREEALDNGQRTLDHTWEEDEDRKLERKGPQCA